MLDLLLKRFNAISLTDTTRESSDLCGFNDPNLHRSVLSSPKVSLLVPLHGEGALKTNFDISQCTNYAIYSLALHISLRRVIIYVQYVTNDNSVLSEQIAS
jgi:hypothetical protein